MHIGDSLQSDVAGANNSKIRSVWVSHGQELDTTLNIKPDYIIEDFVDIKWLLNSLFDD